MDDTPQDKQTPLFDQFPTPTYDEWRAAAVASLGGKPFDTLITPTYEGIPLRPLYRREDIDQIDAVHTIPGRPPYARGAHAAGYLTRPWAIAQELTYGDPAAFNRALLFDLEHGQTAVNILLDAPTCAGQDPDSAASGEVGRGVSLATVEDVTVALAGVDLTTVPLLIRSGTAALPLLALLVAHLRRTGKGSADLHGGLENDPLGELAQQGTLPLSLERAYDEMAELTRWASIYAPRLATVAVHTYSYHDAGGNAVQELAFGLATGVAYLRALARREVEPSTAAPRIHFHFAVGSDFFMEIAKLRASRLLWAQAVAAFGGGDNAQRLHLHARSARRNKTTFSPYVNIIRATTEALAAVVGGVDSFHVAPFDEPARPPDDFSRRVARNIQIILQEEAHLMDVIDPAGGSYAVEVLTDRLARDALALFQEVEREGGMADALKIGSIQSRIAAVADERAANLAAGRDVLVGATRFADPNDEAVAPDEPDYTALYQERVARMTSYRNGRDANHATALGRLAEKAVLAERVIETAVEAAMAGATLGEIARALRDHNEARPIIAPLSPARLSDP